MMKTLGVLLVGSAVLVAALLGVSVVTVVAQQGGETVQLVNVAPADSVIMSVPENWKTWNRADYSDDATATDALFEQLDLLGVGFSRANAATMVETDLSLITFAEPAGGSGLPSMAMLRFLTYDDLVAAGMSPDDITPENILGSRGVAYGGSFEVHDRPAAFGSSDAFYIYYVFPEEELVAELSWLTMPDISADIFNLMTVSVRMKGEPFDLDAGTYSVVAGTDEIPETILLPVAEEESGDASEQPATQEATDATTGQTTVDCSVSAASDVNLRGGPGTNFARAGVLAGGSTAQAVGQATSSDNFVWWRLVDGTWVRSDVVHETGDCDELPAVPAN